MDSVMHFEIPVDDAKRAQKFYSTVFGWKINEMPEMNYTMVQTTETGEDRMPKEAGRINGGMMKRSKDVKAPVITINVEDIDKALAKIEKNCGKVVGKKMEIPNMGWSAYFKDPEDNVIGLFQGKM